MSYATSAEFACPACGKRGGMAVIDSRFTPRNKVIRRRRKCLHCGYRITTREVLTGPGQRANIDKAQKLIAEAMALLKQPEIQP